MPIRIAGWRRSSLRPRSVRTSMPLEALRHRDRPCARPRQPADAGELRLQWWRDLIEGEARGEASANPVAVALIDTVERHDVSRGTLDRCDRGASQGALRRSPASVEALEAFLDDTIGGPIRLKAKVLIGHALPEAEPARHAAVALGASPT